MPLHPKRFFVLLPLLIMAFAPAEEKPAEVANYYSLRFLKESSAPKTIKLIRFDATFQKSMLQEGILISYKNRDAKRVQIAGDFTLWKPRDMDKGNSGVWLYYVTGFPESAAMKYKLICDGIWIRDPMNNDREDDGMGSYVSIINYTKPREGARTTFEKIEPNMVEFKIFKPVARFVSIVGDFNNWNPENDMLIKGRDGIWRLQKRLLKGTYRYSYIIDGKWIHDFYNEETASDDTGNICSVIRIE